MTLKEVKENPNIELDVKIGNDHFFGVKVFPKNNTYATIKGHKVKWELIHKAVNSWFTLTIK